MDNAEDYIEAAHREVYEETGFTLFNEIKPLAFFESNDSVYTTMLTYIPQETSPELNWEHDEANWVSLSELSNLNDLHHGLKALIENVKISNELQEICSYYQNKANSQHVNCTESSLTR